MHFRSAVCILIFMAMAFILHYVTNIPWSNTFLMLYKSAMFERPNGMLAAKGINKVGHSTCQDHLQPFLTFQIRVDYFKILLYQSHYFYHCCFLLHSSLSHNTSGNIQKNQSQLTIEILNLNIPCLLWHNNKSQIMWLCLNAHQQMKCEWSFTQPLRRMKWCHLLENAWNWMSSC
jgi:hypothetical protein